MQEPSHRSHSSPLHSSQTSDNASGSNPQPLSNTLTDTQSTLHDSSEITSHTPTVIDASRLHVDFEDAKCRIGIGTYGAVYVGRYFGEMVAVKRIRMPDTSPALRDDPHVQARRSDAMRQFAREIRRYERISHPGIVRFLGVTLPPDNSSALLVTELMPGGSLGDSVKSLRRSHVSFQVLSVVRIALQACGGLRALHAAKCTWGDAKPENILLSASVGPDGVLPDNAEARIADFGLSKSVGQSLLADTTLTGTNQPAGTYNYMAPEAFMGVEPDDKDKAKAFDIYSFGLIIYEMLTLRTPWRRKQMIEVYSSVMQGERPPWPLQGDKDFCQIPNELQRLVEQCWSQDPMARPAADHVFDALNDFYNRTVNNSSLQRPVSDISASGLNGDLPSDRAGFMMPRVLSKHSTASTAVAVCDPSVDLSSPGLGSTRESARIPDASDGEQGMYDNLDSIMAPGPRVSPVTSPEPRSLNMQHVTPSNKPGSNAVTSSNQSGSSALGARRRPERHAPHPSRSIGAAHAGQQNSYAEHVAAADRLQNGQPIHHKGSTSNVDDFIRADALEKALRMDGSHGAPGDGEILDQFNYQDLHQVPTNDFIKHRDDLVQAAAQAAVHMSQMEDSHSREAHERRNRANNLSIEATAGLSQTGATTLDSSMAELISSNASSTSLRRKRSKRLQTIIENLALAYMELHRREEVSSKMPPKQRKEVIDRKVQEEAKQQAEEESLKIIDTFRSADDYSVVLDQMKTLRDSHSVAKAGLAVLERFCRDENLYFDLCEEGGVEEMVSGASLFGPKDPDLCVTFCNSITFLSEHNDDKVGHLIRGVGVPSLVIEILQTHKTVVGLQTSGCECLSMIARSSELSRSAVATLGGPSVVYHAMWKNNTSFKDVDLAKSALKAICQIAHENEKAAEFLVQVAALDTVSMAADVFTDHGLEKDVLTALRAFSFYNGGRRNIIMSSGLKALTAIMQRNEDPEFMVECCTFIRAIARWRDLECEEAMLQSCIAERITAVMQMSNNIPGEEGARVAWYANHACTFLASFGAKSRQRLRMVGAIDTAIGIITSRKENARVVHSATDALAELIKNDAEAKAYAEKCNAVPALTEALDLHANYAKVRTAIQWTLDYLSSSVQGPAYGSRAHQELMSNNEGVAPKVNGKAQQKPGRRFLGFNFSRRKG